MSMSPGRSSCEARPEKPGAICFGGFAWHAGTGVLTKDGVAVALTDGASAMLHALVSRPRQPQSRETLAELTRACAHEPLTRSIDLQISRLRKVIEPDPLAPRFIQTVRGLGYVFEPNGAVRCWSSSSARSPRAYPVSTPASWCSLSPALRMDDVRAEAAQPAMNAGLS